MPEGNEVAALRPPAWAEKYRWHWIIDSDMDFYLAEWWHEEQWRFSSGVRHHWRALIDRGWRYSHPADPSARVIDPDDEAMVECAVRKWLLEPHGKLSDNFPLVMRFDNLDQFLNCIRALIDTPASEVLDARDAEIERGAIEMSLSDVYSLDDVVVALGIEDSDTTPAEAVEELKAEIERLREVVRTMQDDTFFAGCYLNGVTPDLNTQTPDEVEEIEARMESLTNRWRQEGTERAREAARQTLDREPTKP